MGVKGLRKMKFVVLYFKNISYASGIEVLVFSLKKKSKGKKLPGLSMCN